MSNGLFLRNGLSLERLDTLCEIAGKGLIGRAAQERGLKQSQFSKQLQALEGYFQTNLFDRKKKVLTEAGSRLVALAQPFLNGLGRFSAELDGNRIYSIGAGEAFIDWVLVPKFSELRGTFPRTHWAFENLTSGEIRRRLFNLSLDFGILRKEACGEDGQLETHDLGSMKIGLFVPTGLKGRRSIPTVSLSGSEQFTGLFERIVRSLNPPHEIVLTCASFPAIKNFVRCGDLAGPLPLIGAKDFVGPEFEMLMRPAFENLTRHYVLAVNPKNPLVHPESRRVFDKLGTFCRLPN